METLREEQILRWANYVRNNPDWKNIHTEFINAQFSKYKDFVKRLLETTNGKEKLELLRKSI